MELENVFVAHSFDVFAEGASAFQLVAFNLMFTLGFVFDVKGRLSKLAAKE